MKTNIQYFKPSPTVYQETIHNRESSSWFPTALDYIHRGEVLANDLIHLYPDFDLGEIDIAVSAGGMNGYVAAAMWSILRPLQEMGRLKIVRAKGSSAGGISAFLILKNCEVIDWISTFFAWRALERERVQTHCLPSWLQDIRVFSCPSLGKDMFASAFEVDIGKDDHILLSQRLHLVLTLVKPFLQVSEEVISQFSSRDDLMKTLMGTMKIPGWIQMDCKIHDAQAYDGGLINLRPIFRDELRPQIVVDIAQFNYISTTISCEYDFFQTLFQPMQNAAYEFLKHRVNTPIHMLIRPEDQKNIHRKSYIGKLIRMARMVIISILLALCIIWRKRILGKLAIVR